MKIKTFFNRLFIIILLLFAGFVFYLGWEQLELSENSYGVVFTKTSGWKSKVLTTGGFNWSFEKVIPNNYKIHKFKISNIDFSYSESGELPSSKIYAEFNNIPSSNFNYSYTLTGTFKYKAEYLIGMVQNGTFTQDNFQSWEDNKKSEIINSLKTYISDSITDNQLLTIEGAATTFLQDNYQFLDFSKVTLNLNSPDMVLYTLSRERYIENLTAQKEAEEKYLVESLRQQNSEQLKLDLLKQYGEVFTQYPIMIEYLKVDQGMLLDRATMDDFIASTTDQNQK